MRHGETKISGEVVMVRVEMDDGKIHEFERGEKWTVEHGVLHVGREVGRTSDTGPEFYVIASFPWHRVIMVTDGSAS